MKGSEIKIYNTAGQLIQAKEIDNDQEDSTVYIFDIRSFENGVYYLVAEKGDKIQTSQKIIKAGNFLVAGFFIEKADKFIRQAGSV